MPGISSAKITSVQEEILAPLSREAGYAPAWVTQTLQGIMIPNFILYIKKESRCSHYRLDYPDLDEKNWRAWINIYKGSDGAMKLEKQPFDIWPARSR